METLAVEAVRAAATLRFDNGVGQAQGLCPYDLAIKLGIKVSFISAPTLEGMYSPETAPASIVLNCERPAGRRRYTCGHEIGHHIFKHGTRFDQLEEEQPKWNPEEYLAQRFSSALLMPKLAVVAAFSRRGWTLASATTEQYFVVAQEFGVGLSALITNSEVNLKAISGRRAGQLRENSTSEVRQKLAGRASAYDVFLVDQHWLRPTVDVEVGDLIIFPEGTRVDPKFAIPSGDQKNHFVAVAPGQTKILFSSGASAPVLRVSKRGYIGLARHRHVEEVLDDE